MRKICEAYYSKSIGLPRPAVGPKFEAQKFKK
jgi:hypothetical protein